MLPTTRSRRRPRRALAAATTAALACSGCGASGPLSEPDPGDRVQCETASTALPSSLVPARRFEPATSAITMKVVVARARLREALERRVPEQLARGGRRLSVGQVSYSVRRGPMGLELVERDLEVQVPIRVNAAVCVPLGPLCPSVGGCSPRLTTIVRVPLSLDQHYGLGGSRVSTDLQQGCVVAGYDATGHVRANADAQSRNLKRQLDRSLPNIRPEMTALWTRLHEPLPVHGGHCLHAQPQRVVQHPPAMQASDLVFRLDIIASLRHERTCMPIQADRAVTALPPPDEADSRGESGTLVVAEYKSWQDVSQEISRSLAKAKALGRDDRSLTEVVARGVLTKGGADGSERARIALGLTLEGEPCGPIWMLAEPRLAEDGKQIRLVDVTRLALGEQRREQEADGQLVSWIRQHAVITMPSPPIGTPEALADAIELATRKRTNRVDVRAYRTEPAEPQVHVTADGLVVEHRQRGAVPLRVK